MIKATNKTARVIKLSVTAIVLAILIVCLTSCHQYGGHDTVLSKEELSENVAKDTSKEFDYIADYFDLWSFPTFDLTKVKLTEKKFNDACVITLPSTKEHAVKAAERFLEKYYETTDLTDPVAVTDAILYSYVYATGDRYAYYRTKADSDDFATYMSGEFVGIGIAVTLPEDGTLLIKSVYEDSCAEAAGLKSGDVIIAVNGTLLTVENQETMLDSIKGEEGTQVSITVQRGDEELTVSVTRAKIKEKTVSYSVEDGIGYVKITSFKGNTADQFIKAMDAIREAKAGGVLFDLRDNPGGYLSAVVEAIDHLIPINHKIVSYKDKNSAERTTWSTGAYCLDIPVVVLCNGNTASAGELFTAALRDYSKSDLIFATVVGEVTYGKGVMQSTYRLTDGSSITFTSAHYYPPCGVNYDKDGNAPDGIEPSIIVSDDPLTSDNDEQYDAAIDELTALMQMHTGTISKEDLLKNMESFTDRDLQYMSQYLKEWKFPRFNSTKLNSLQNVYQTNVATSFDVYLAAKELASVFINDHYESTELSDYNDMTASLINSWLTTLNDEFGQYRTVDEHNDYVQEVTGTSVGIGISYSLGEVHTIVKVIPGGPADMAGVKVGDVLLSVNGILFTDNTEQIRNLILNTTKPEVNISVSRPGQEEPIDFSIKRASINEKSVAYKVVDGNIGYIQITKFQNTTTNQFSLAVNDLLAKGVVGFIFDVRNNGGGELVQTVNTIEYLAKKGDVIMSIDYYSENYPSTTVYSQQSFTIDLPCVVLCNKSTASAAELFTAAIRDYAKAGRLNAKVVGDETTFGKGVMQSTVKLYDGTSITYTVAKYNPPSGVNYDGIGIIPDIIVKDDGSTYDDEQLEAAIDAMRDIAAN